MAGKGRDPTVRSLGFRVPGACVVCGRPMMTAWYQNGWGERWCKRHGEVGACIWCQRVEGVVLDDGRRRCGSCRATGVDGPDQVRALQGEVLAALATWFGPHGLDVVPVEAVGGSLVVRGARRVGRTHSWTSGDIGAAKISLTPGMPRVLAGAVLAHEYGHVLLNFDQVTLARRPSSLLEPRQVEGFCEVVAAEWLASVADAEADHHRAGMDNSPDPVYGDGFRLMQARREALGSVAALLAEVARPSMTVDPAPAPVAPAASPGRSRVRRSAAPSAAPKPLPPEPGSGSRVKGPRRR